MNYALIIAAFLTGIAAGVAGYRSYIMEMLRHPPYTACDYCKYEIERRELFPPRKK